MRIGQITVASLLLFVPVSSSCNSLTGIDHLPNGVGPGGDKADPSGGRSHISTGGGSPSSGGFGGEKADATGGAGGVGGTADPSVGGRRATGGVNSLGGETGSGGEATGGSMQGETGGSGGVPPFEGLPLLDDFSTALDTDRWVQLFDFEASAGALRCKFCGDALLWNKQFALPQAASVRLISFPLTAAEANVVLLAQSNVCDLVEVLYAPDVGGLQIVSCQDGDWKIHNMRPLLIGAGSTVEGRARASTVEGNIVVEVFVDGEFALDSDFAFNRASGRVGVSGICFGPDCEGEIVFDDFRGGVTE